MYKIAFVTSDEKKVKSAQKYFNDIKLVFYKYDLVEPRSESLEEIAQYKVMQAYDIVKSECIALDSGFYIDALNGWPGTFVNFNLKMLGLEGILQLLENKPNRNAYFKECLTYFDGVDFKYFYGISKGSIALCISEADNPYLWSSLGKLFIPQNCSKTMADMTEEELNNRNDDHTSAFREFNNYVKQLKCKKR